MKYSTIKITQEDSDYLEKIKKKYMLGSKTNALQLIITKIKFMKVDGELR